MIVYAGAILVAYVFVIMLAQQARPAEYNVTVRQPVLALTAGGVLIIAVLWALMQSGSGAARDMASRVYAANGGPAANAVATQDNVVNLGSVLFGSYPVSIEVAGVFLLIAMIGAIVLAGMRIQRQAQQS